jgi:hypothetical protein
MEFLGALVKLRKADVSFVLSVGLSVRPSIRTEQLAPAGRTAHKFDISVFFKKSLDKIKFR